MFIALNSLLNNFTKRHKIKNTVDKITAAELSERVIKSVIASDVKVVWCKDDRVLLKAVTGAAANEVRLKEPQIKKELQKNNIKVSSIRCII